MLAAVRERGPVRSADFERTDGKAGGWWEWKTEKRALEMLFTAGELMIARRHNFQRIYDLRERVLPAWDDAGLPPLERCGARWRSRPSARWASPRRAGCRLLPHRQEGDRATFVGAGATRARCSRVRSRAGSEPAYVHPDNRKLLKAAAAGELAPGADHAALAVRPAGVGPRARARGVRLRLPDRVLHARAEAALRLLHAADPAPRRARRPARPEGAPQGGRLRGQGAAP